MSLFKMKQVKCDIDLNISLTRKSELKRKRLGTDFRLLTLCFGIEEHASTSNCLQIAHRLWASDRSNPHLVAAEAGRSTGEANCEKHSHLRLTQRPTPTCKWALLSPALECPCEQQGACGHAQLTRLALVGSGNAGFSAQKVFGLSTVT